MQKQEYQDVCRTVLDTLVWRPLVDKNVLVAELLDHLLSKRQLFLCFLFPPHLGNGIVVLEAVCELLVFFVDG